MALTKWPSGGVWQCQQDLVDRARNLCWTALVCVLMHHWSKCREFICVQVGQSVCNVASSTPLLTGTCRHFLRMLAGRKASPETKVTRCNYPQLYHCSLIVLLSYAFICHSLLISCSCGWSMVERGRTMQLTKGMYRGSPLTSSVLVLLGTGMNSSPWYKPTLCIPIVPFLVPSVLMMLAPLPFTVRGACVEVGH